MAAAVAATAAAGGGGKNATYERPGDAMLQQSRWQCCEAPLQRRCLRCFLPKGGPHFWGPPCGVLKREGPAGEGGMKGPGANRDPRGYTMIPDGRT